MRSEDRLALVLSRTLHEEVPVLEAFLRDAPAQGFLLAYQGDIEVALLDCPVERRIEVAIRTVAMDARWPNVFKLLEEYQLAAAVDIVRLWEWERNSDRDFGGGLIGLISVAERAGITYESGKRFGSEHYGNLTCRDHCRDLPSLLVHYLTVYEEMGFLSRSQAG